MPDTPHPDHNPQFSKSDYIRNSVFAIAKMNMCLYLSEGANLQETAKLAQHLQEAIKLAYHSALQDAGVNTTGQPPTPPSDNFSDGNPFA